MRIAVLGATGDLGRECVARCLEVGHDVTALVRNPTKIPADWGERVKIVGGDALDPRAVETLLGGGDSVEGACDAVLFALGVDANSPEDLCTNATRHLLDAMPRVGVKRLVWCGGGSNFVAEDEITFGARIVEFVAKNFLGLRHRDKVHQLELLDANREIEWIGIRPLQMKTGPSRPHYRVGFHRFSPLSTIHFVDCAHAMVEMLESDEWLYRAPIIQY